MRFLSNRYFHLMLAVLACVAGVKLWMQPQANTKLHYFIMAAIILVVFRSIQRFRQL
jgi:hypothetical protein